MCIRDRFNSAGIRTSVFVAADPEMVEYAAKAGADRVELYTEPYATAYPVSYTHLYFFMPEGPESDSYEGPVGRSAPSVRSPHHLAAEGIEENMIEPFHYFYTVVCPANGCLLYTSVVHGMYPHWTICPK